LNEETSWLKFYDYNLIINSDDLQCIEQFDILEKNNQNRIRTTKSLIKINNTSKEVIRKIERKIKLNKLIDGNILSRFDSKINLKNHLLKSEIDEVDLILNKIIKLLIILEKFDSDENTFVSLYENINIDIKYVM